ncbi:hypothetical protein NQZ68_002145 [Dissostichus eleginoides]|nr:hypothetical protein NQZ68_002145 [Dissostichus eleginoides]
MNPMVGPSHSELPYLQAVQLNPGLSLQSQHRGSDSGAHGCCRVPSATVTAETGAAADVEAELREVGQGAAGCVQSKQGLIMHKEASQTTLSPPGFSLSLLSVSSAVVFLDDSEYHDSPLFPFILHGFPLPAVPAQFRKCWYYFPQNHSSSERMGGGGGGGGGERKRKINIT